MNGNTPDQAELRGNIENILNAEYACPKCGWSHQLTNNDHKSTTDQLLALFAQQPSSQAIERAKEELLFDLDEIDNKPWRVFKQLVEIVPQCAEMYTRYQRFYENGGANEVEKLIEQFEACLTEPNETGRKA